MADNDEEELKKKQELQNEMIAQMMQMTEIINERQRKEMEYQKAIQAARELEEERKKAAGK
jgi:hypothetical protein